MPLTTQVNTGTPGHCEHAGALTDCEYDLNELLEAIAAGDGFGVSGHCGTCGELVDRTYQDPRTTSEENEAQGPEMHGKELVPGDNASTVPPDDEHAEAVWESEGGAIVDQRNGY